MLFSFKMAPAAAGPMVRRLRYFVIEIKFDTQAAAGVLIDTCLARRRLPEHGEA
jgi:hypothetical protein